MMCVFALKKVAAVLIPIILVVAGILILGELRHQKQKLVVEHESGDKYLAVEIIQRP